MKTTNNSGRSSPFPLVSILLLAVTMLVFPTCQSQKNRSKNNGETRSSANITESQLSDEIQTLEKDLKQIADKLARIRQKMKRLRKKKGNGAGGSKPKFPEPDGKILSRSGSMNLMNVSVGKNGGVKEGMTLRVVDQKEKTVIGKLKVITVQAKTSTTKSLKREEIRDPKVGDLVFIER